MRESFFSRPRCLAAVALIVAASALHAQQSPAPAPAPSPSRGELLYSTHCVECHTVQMHWRTLRKARDWDTLKAQVRRWQDTAKLGWSDADIEEVARHLNDTIYQYPQPPNRASVAQGHPRVIAR